MGRYIISYMELRLGDIILDREDSDESRKIRRITNAEYSHVRIYVGDTIIEANGIGVQSVNPQRIIYESPDDVVILRCKNASTQVLFQAICYARSEFAKEYGIGKLDNTQYCFRLVAEAYEYAGIKIVRNPRKCSANDFLQSPCLTIIPNMIHEADAKELEIAYGQGIMQDKGHYNQQTEAAAEMFAMIRKYVNEHGDDSDTIQDDDRLFFFLVQNPQYDTGISQILKSSPYFQLWKQYKDQNAWEFNVEDFIRTYGVNAKDIATQILDSCAGMTPRIWYTMFCCVSGIYEQYHFESAKVYVELYENLLKMNEQRKNVAVTVLEICDNKYETY